MPSNPNIPSPVPVIEKKFTARRTITALAAAGLLVSVPGCVDTPSTPSSSVDSDGDGIRDSLDPNPNHPGLTPPKDTVFPSPSPILSYRPTLPNTQNTPNQLPCMRGYGPDSDGDGKPDHCDYVIGNKDSDGDGLDDRYDSAPNTKDRDNDGIWDGADSNPDVSKYVEDRRTQDRLAEQRRQRQLEEQRRQAEQDYWDSQFDNN